MATPKKEKYSRKERIFTVTGIICEYNPFHAGHKKQLDIVRQQDPTGAIVCLMSGDFVQRGAPAVFDKTVRAKAALLAGADLVLELPVTGALSSAEGFAATGVSILSPFCQQLSFGAENAVSEALIAIAESLLSSAFSEHLKLQLEKGLSFPAARQAALTEMGVDPALLSLPNNILAVEYCKAILAQKSDMKPAPILRQGSYHDTAPDQENPSATSLRALIEKRQDWVSYIPAEARATLEYATVHSLAYGERAILAKLRTMTDAKFEQLPFGSEGLWRKLMHAARKEATLEAIIAATKSKRYTRTRIDRMVLCAFLGITDEMLRSPVPYVRVLALNDRGREVLKQARKTGHFPNIGQRLDEPYQDLEDRCSALYGLFARNSEPPNAGRPHRIYYHDG